MSKLVLLLLLPVPIVALGQNVVIVSPQQCVWRAGDDPAWAAPNIDESGWQPLEQFKLPDQFLTLPEQPRSWVRCHADLLSLKTLARPALQILFNATSSRSTGTAQTSFSPTVQTGCPRPSALSASATCPLLRDDKRQKNRVEYLVYHSSWNRFLRHQSFMTHQIKR
jgi:hypothetical protein